MLQTEIHDMPMLSKRTTKLFDAPALFHFKKTENKIFVWNVRNWLAVLKFQAFNLHWPVLQNERRSASRFVIHCTQCVAWCQSYVTQNRLILVSWFYCLHCYNSSFIKVYFYNTKLVMLQQNIIFLFVRPRGKVIRDKKPVPSCWTSITSFKAIY